MEKIEKITNFEEVNAAIYDELYTAYEKLFDDADYWHKLYDYVVKERDTYKQRYDAVATMVNNAAEVVKLLNN